MGVESARAVILAGGRGTRFWPLSRHARPKQLLDFTGEGSLLSLTVERVSPLVPPERQWIITSEDLAPQVRAAVPQIPAHQVLAEPVGRNTAPAVALAAVLLRSESDGEAPPFAVLPSDHLISAADDFRADLRRALEIADQGRRLVTFGVPPTRAETGYGYVEAGGELQDLAPAREVLAFREKPDRATAERYVAGDRHLWNSGMFVWTADTVLDGLRRHAPEVVAPLRELGGPGAPRPGTAAFQSALKEAYEQVPSVSIDVALLERADNVAVIPAGFGWNDVGHWLAMRDLWSHDPEGNAARGRVVGIDSHDNVIHGPDRLTALVGVDGLIVVQTDDATLVCRADRAQDVKQLLEQLGDPDLRRYL